MNLLSFEAYSSNLPFLYSMQFAERGQPNPETDRIMISAPQATAASELPSVTKKLQLAHHKLRDCSEKYNKSVLLSQAEENH